MAASSQWQAPPLIQPPGPPQSPPPFESSPTVAAEYRRIFNAHPRHFLTLSLLFLPISFFPLLIPAFQKTLTSAISAPSAVQITLLLISSLFIFTSYLLAIGSITDSVHRAFHSTTPLTLTSSIHSFSPLITTALYAQLPVFVTLLLFRYLLQLSGLKPVLTHMILAMSFGILQLVWGLAYAVAVVESKSGVRAWKRSFDLMMMTRNTGLGCYCRSVFWNGLYMGLLVWGMSASLPLLTVKIPCFVPGLVLTLLRVTMSFGVLYMMSLRLTVDDDVENPLLVFVC